MNSLKDELKNLLHKNHTFLDLVLETANDGICFWDIENTDNKWANSQFWKTLGYPENTPQQTQIWKNLLDTDDFKKQQNLLQSFSQSSQDNFKADFKYLHKNGTNIWLRLNGLRVHTNDSQNNRILVTCTNITDQKEKELILQKNIERYQHIIDGAHFGSWEYNVQTKEVILNERWANIIGYNLSDIGVLNTESWTKHIHPDYAEKIFTALQDHIDGKTEFYAAEFLMKHREGHWVWIYARGKVVSKTPDGKTEWLAGSNYDITTRKENELVITRDKQLLEHINEYAKIGVWEVDLIKSSVYWSPEIKKLMDVPLDFEPSLEDAIGFFNEGESRDCIAKAVNLAIETGENYDLDLQVVTTKNEIKWARTIGISNFENGKCTRLYGFFQDINDIKKAQDEIALKEEQFRTTFKYSKTGIAFIDFKGEIQETNQSIRDILGYTEDEMTGMPMNDIVHPEDLENSLNLLRDMASGKIQGSSLEKKYLNKSGKTVWTNITMTAIKNDKGEISHFVKQLIDITARKENDLLLLKNADLMKRLNRVAQVGVWEVNFENNTVNWSDYIKDLTGVPQDFVPTFQDVIARYQEGEHRESFINSIKNSIENGGNFDLELQLQTEDNITVWTRTIGISEFKNGKCVRLYGFLQNIDDKTKNAKNLATKEEEFRQTFNHATLGFAVVGLNGNIIKTNKSATDILGYTEAEMQNLSYADITHPDDMEQTSIYYNELINRERDFYKLEKRYKHKQGHYIWVHITFTTILNDEGELLHFLAQLIDISERKKNELLLLNYKNLLDHSNEVAKIASWEINLINNEAFWSDNLETVIEEDNKIPSNIVEVLDRYILTKDKTNLENLIHQAIKNGQHFDLELQIKTKNNRSKWMRLVGISDYKNGTCTKLHGLIQNIDTIKKTQIEIIIKEELFRQTFTHAGIGMALIDLKGKITQANARLCEIVGYTEEEIKKGNISDFSHPDDIESSQKLLIALIQGKQDRFQLEKRYIHKNGKVIWTRISSAAVKNDQGDTSHIVSQIQDINDNKLLTQNLIEHNNRLLNFAHIVSHNLRSHTGNMSMLLDINAMNNPELNQDEIYQHIKSSSDNLNDTVQYLSEIVEINTKSNKTLESINLYKYVQKSIESVQASIKQANCKTSIDVDKNLLVLAIPAYLESIILNLVTNAIKYRDPEKESFIKIKSGIDKNYIYLKITDNGLGIDLQKHKSKLFGMYKTFHKHKDSRGLGLFIIKNQIEAINGKIEVKSIINKGTTFTTYFKYANNN